MKRVFFVVMLLLGLGIFSSCSKDDMAERALVGTLWESYTINGKTYNSGSGALSRLEFPEKGKVIFTYFGDSIKGEYSVEGNTIYFNLSFAHENDLEQFGQIIYHVKEEHQLKTGTITDSSIEAYMTSVAYLYKTNKIEEMRSDATISFKKVH